MRDNLRYVGRINDDHTYNIYSYEFSDEEYSRIESNLNYFNLINYGQYFDFGFFKLSSILHIDRRHFNDATRLALDVLSPIPPVAPAAGGARKNTCKNRKNQRRYKRSSHRRTRRA
jgi:hypothetical protein